MGSPEEGAAGSGDRKKNRERASVVREQELGGVEIEAEGSPEVRSPGSGSKMMSGISTLGPMHAGGNGNSRGERAAEGSFVEGEGGGLETEERGGEPTVGMRSHRQEET